MQRSTAVLLNYSEVKFSAVPYRDMYRIVTLLVIHSPSRHDRSLRTMP